MTQSIRDQIVARFAAALTGTLPGAISVYRSREDAISRGEASAVVVRPEAEETLSVSEFLDLSHFNVDVEVVVRGDPWDGLADPIIAAAHPLLVNDAQLASLCAKIRRVSAKWEAHEADQTVGVLSQTYRVQYHTAIDQL